jgi:hypothetical protein
MKKIATAVSKDKQICVHDLSSDKPTIVNTLTHSGRKKVNDYHKL